LNGLTSVVARTNTRVTLGQDGALRLMGLEDSPGIYGH
jgi:hypothetical protein